MISTFPYNLSDIFKEVYWVNQYVTDDPLPPEVNGTVFKFTDALPLDPHMVDIVGRVNNQSFYDRNRTSLNRLVKDSNLGGLTAPQNIFLGYEHRVFIGINKAILGYSTWDEIKPLVTEEAIHNASILGFRNRPTSHAGTFYHGNAYLGSSTYYDSIMNGTKLTGIKWAFLGHYDRKNIPCGRGLFIYRTITNGVIVETENQYAAPISAPFTRYFVDVYGEISTTTETLYYHAVDNKWKIAIDGANASGFYHHPDIIPGVFGETINDRYVYKIDNGEITEEKYILPVIVDIKLFEKPTPPAPGEPDTSEPIGWVDGTKNWTGTNHFNFTGAGYKIGGVPLNGIYIEAQMVNGVMKHETKVTYTYWGVNEKYWKYLNGMKVNTEEVDVNLPFIE